MSRSFTPPPTLSKDDVRTIADVRRDIWTSAFRGMAAGGFGCLGLHTAAYVGQGRKWIRLPATLTRNTAMASFMMGAAAGSFLSATATGKNEVHQLHPVFAIGARPPPPPPDSPTAAKGLDADLLRAKRREDELKALVRQRRRASSATGIDRNDSGGGGGGAVDDRLERERIRLLRRASLQEQLQSGGAGSRRTGSEDRSTSATTTDPKEPLFVDTPIVTASTNERIDMQRNRLIRRASLTHSLQPHHHDHDHHTTPTSK